MPFRSNYLGSDDTVNRSVPRWLIFFPCIYMYKCVYVYSPIRCLICLFYKKKVSQFFSSLSFSFNSSFLLLDAFFFKLQSSSKGKKIPICETLTTAGFVYMATILSKINFYTLEFTLLQIHFTLTLNIVLRPILVSIMLCLRITIIIHSSFSKSIVSLWIIIN